MLKSPAGLGIRFIAGILDSIFLFFTSYLILGNIMGGYTEIIDGIYFIIVPIIWYGYTIGKKGLWYSNCENGWWKLRNTMIIMSIYKKNTSKKTPVSF